jgi:hypothetical protein
MENLTKNLIINEKTEDKTNKNDFIELNNHKIFEWIGNCDLQKIISFIDDRVDQVINITSDKQMTGKFLINKFELFNSITPCSIPGYLFNISHNN